MTNWMNLIEQEMDDRGDKGPIIHNSLTDNEMLVEFNDGYGGSEGIPFTAWTDARVYFPVVYDGSEWVGSAPRNPNNEETPHIGGQ
ncbi:MAG: hypothetical protein JKY81_01735 [Colwellia sp.]|nr:hypothetical protein [Colwellia sp.]